MKSIREVRRAFNVTARALRYYEEVGILSPKRTETNQRLYSRKEVAKLKLIERGQKFGFTLEEIKEMVLLFDRDRTGKKQLERTIAYGDERLNDIDAKIAELNVIKQEIQSLQSEFIQRLEQMEEE